MLSFRVAMLADVAHIVALVNGAYRGESSRAGWTTEAELLDGQRTDADEVSQLIRKDDSLILLGLQGGEIIGCVHLQHGDHAASMGMLVIRPDWQGKGLGKKLMREAEVAAVKMWGVNRMQMHVVTLRHELIAFYERRGYRRSGMLKAFPNEVRFGIQKVTGLQIELMEKILQ